MKTPIKQEKKKVAPKKPMKASQTVLEKKNTKDAMENKNMRPPFQQKGKVTAVVVKTKSAPSKKPVVKAGAVIKTSPMAMKKKKC